MPINIEPWPLIGGRMFILRPRYLILASENNDDLEFCFDKQKIK